MKSLLKGKGLEPTTENLGGVDHAVRNKAFSALNYVLKSTFPGKYKEYSGLDDDTKKREWLSSFMMDPASGGFEVSKIIFQYS